MIGAITDWILGLHGSVALAVVFLLPALESSAFVGFVVPGEIGVLLGGVLASRHNVGLGAVLAAGVAGALVGDSVGYEVGRRWGRRLLHGGLGRFVKAGHLERAERYLRSRGGKAVFFGRFTAALRVLVPGLAGMSGMSYGRFFLANAAGGTLWAAGLGLAGYLAGDSWRKVEHAAGRASVVLLLLVGLVALVLVTARWVGRHQDRLTAFVSERLDRPPVRRLRARYERQIGFLARRFEPGGAFGLSLTAALAALVGAGWILGAVLRDVVVGHGSIRFDRPVLEWFARHREPWLTTAARIVTGLGSSVVLIPLVLAVGGWYRHRRHTTRALTLLGATYGGAYLLAQAIKTLVARPRPPAALAAGHFPGYAFPSGHATQSAAVFCMLATVAASTTPRWRRKVAVWAAAILIATIVGITRLYLGAHWLTDVLGGSALGTLWFLLVLATSRAIAGLRARPDPSLERR